MDVVDIVSGENGQVYACKVEVGPEMWHSEKSYSFTTAV